MNERLGERYVPAVTARSRWRPVRACSVNCFNSSTFVGMNERKKVLRSKKDNRGIPGYFKLVILVCAMLLLSHRVRYHVAPLNRRLTSKRALLSLGAFDHPRFPFTFSIIELSYSHKSWDLIVFFNYNQSCSSRLNSQINQPLNPFEYTIKKGIAPGEQL
jgi:hypothetical protein